MAKFCNNGHQMEDSWEICPFCHKTGYAAAAPPVQKTRIEMPGTPSAAAGAAPAPVAGGSRKTVLISERRKPAVVGWLVALSGDQKGEDLRLRDGQNIVGSATDADVLIKDPTVSGKHASVRYKEGKFSLVDLDSSNGTYLNDSASPIAREELKDNDIIRVGEVTLKFKAL